MENWWYSVVKLLNIYNGDIVILKAVICIYMHKNMHYYTQKYDGIVRCRYIYSWDPCYVIVKRIYLTSNREII